MKNLLLVVLLTVSSAVYSQEFFRLSGNLYQNDYNVTFVNVYVSSKDKEDWIYYCSVDAFKDLDYFYNVSVPINNQIYLVEFVNGEEKKRIYITTPEEGNFKMDVEFKNKGQHATIFYNRTIKEYDYKIGTEEELFGSSM